MAFDPTNLQKALTKALQYPLATAAISILVLVVAVKILFPRANHPTYDGDTRTPTVADSWLPFLGHGPQMLFNKEHFTSALAKKYPEGVFSLQILGKNHHIVYDPALLGRLLNRPHTSAAEKWTQIRMLERTFTVAKEDAALYVKLTSDKPELFKLLLSEPGLGAFIEANVKQVKAHISEFVSFNISLADQMGWERLADVDVVTSKKGEPFVEADLLALTRHFVAHTANPALFGTDFVQNFPDFFDLLWKFDAGLVLFATGVPGWLPLPRQQRAIAARGRLLTYTREYQEAMSKFLDGEDPGARWQDLENCSAFMKERIISFQKRGISLRGRAACDLSLAWAMNANSSQLVGWLLFELYRDPVLLAQIREEIAPHVRSVQPPNEFGPAVWLAPELESVDVDGLVTKCPLLKAAYWETLRVYTGLWTVKNLSEDVVLQGKGREAEGFLLQQGSFAHVAGELHQLDTDYFPNPKEWRHYRHLREVVDENGQTKTEVDMGTLRPYGKCMVRSAWDNGIVANLYRWGRLHVQRPGYCPSRDAPLCSQHYYILRYFTA